MTWRDTSARRGARPGGADQLLRRARLRGQRRTPGTRRRCGSGCSTAGPPLRHHPVRHRDHARAARREGLPDHRPGHRRHRHPAGPRHGVGGVEEEARLHRQALVQPGPRTRTRSASSWSGCCRSTGTRVLPEGSQIVEFCTDDALPPPPVPMLGPRHLELPQRRARSHLRAGAGQGRAGPGSARPCTCPSTGRWCRWRSPVRCWSTRKERAAMADTLGTHEPAAAVGRSSSRGCRIRLRSLRNRSSRWSTCAWTRRGPVRRQRRSCSVSSCRPPRPPTRKTVTPR